MRGSVFDVIEINCTTFELRCFNVVVEENLLMFPVVCYTRRLFC